jgi:hypothetical protein
MSGLRQTALTANRTRILALGRERASVSAVPGSPREPSRRPLATSGPIAAPVLAGAHSGRFSGPVARRLHGAVADSCFSAATGPFPTDVASVGRSAGTARRVA